MTRQQTAEALAVLPELSERLGTASAQSLLGAIERLTHLVHVAARDDTADEYRAQRDLVRAECLRRMGGE